MKHLYALFLLLVFLLAACAGQTPAATTTPQTTAAPLPEGIRNIIIIIGDGMGDNQILAGETLSGRNVVFHDWPRVHADTNCLNSEGTAADKTTDSAAAATALATGQLTASRRVGRDFDGKTDLKTIMDHAHDLGKSTGVVSTDDVSGATPASFSGHAADRGDTYTILLTQLASDVDLFCANKSAEAYALKSTITKSGYTYISNLSQIQQNMDSDKLYCQLAMSGSAPSVTLEELLPSVLNYLDQDPDGFVLMVEQGYIDKYCHNNELEPAQRCVIMLDDGVKSVLSWLGDRDDTAIIITADHETGGLQVQTGEDGATTFQFTSVDHSNAPVSVYTYGFTPKLSALYINEEEQLIKNTGVFEMSYDLLLNPIQ